MADGASGKRSSSDKVSDRLCSKGQNSGVGGRQKSGQGATDGGGYLDICTEQDTEFGGEIEMRELRRMGLPRVWLDVARLTGPKKWLEIWRLLDRDELIEQDGRLRMTLPRFRLYQRYQRNRFIEALANDGCSAKEIRIRVRKDLGEQISISQVCRLMRGGDVSNG